MPTWFLGFLDDYIDHLPVDSFHAGSQERFHIPMNILALNTGICYLDFMSVDGAMVKF